MGARRAGGCVGLVRGGGVHNGRGAGWGRRAARRAAPPHLIRIDIDPAEMRRLVPHAGIVADADAGTRALLSAVRRLRGRKGAAKSTPKGGGEARARVAAAKDEARATIEKVQPQLAYLDV